MTSFSIAVSSLTAICVGLVAGRSLRSLRGGIALSTALAMATGLLLLQMSKWRDLSRIVQPKVALDWLPLACLLVAAVVLVKETKLRIALSIALVILTPVRLLWGSIHLQPEQLKLPVMMSLAGWAIALAVSAMLPERILERRASWKTLTWMVATVGTVLIIAASGSMTYGVAVVVCGLAILGVLIATSQIQNTAAFPIIAVIGLSAAFAELPIWNAGLLLVAWCGILLVEQLQSRRLAVLCRATVAMLLILVGSSTLVRLKEDLATDDSWNKAYGSLRSDSSNASQDTTTSSSPSDGTVQHSTTKTDESSGSPSSSVDPFDGFDL